MNNILIATKNKGKVGEFKALFNTYNIEIKSLDDLERNIPDVEETGTTFKENARLKAEEISALLNCPVIADDSGLVIDALDGRPGVYSARYAGEPRSDKRNNDKVLSELENVSEADRTARFVCVLALAIPGEETLFKTGICEGSIGFKPVGSNGFGYDPIFIPNGYAQTLAELSNEEKNAMSHRFHALKKLEDVIIKKKDK